MGTIENILSQEVVQRLGWTLVHFVWQGFAAAIVLAVVLRVLRDRSAELRYSIACITLALIVIMPVITFRMVEVNAVRPMPQAEKTLATEVTENKEIIKIKNTDFKSEKKETSVGNKLPTLQSLEAMIEPVLPYAVAGWVAGVFGLSLWHLGGWTQLQRLRRRMVKDAGASLKAKVKQLSEALGIQKAVDIVESALVSVPTVVGHFKPVILLPISMMTGLSAEQVEAILAHELAHVKRCDYLVNILQTVVEILGFYHPAVWWVSHKIRIERENCCDDLAVSISGDKIRYARALTTMEEIRAGQSVLAVAASGGNLFDRIRRLVGKDERSKEGTSWAASIIVILLALGLTISASLALSSHVKNEISKDGKFKTIMLSIPEGDIEEINRATFSMFDFSTEKIINIQINFDSLTKRERGDKLFKEIANKNADIMIYDKDKRFLTVASTMVECQKQLLKEVENFSAEKLAAHIRAAEKNKPAQMFEIPLFRNEQIDNNDIGIILTGKGVVAVIQTGRYDNKTQKAELKYMIVGRVNPDNLPEPKLLKELSVSADKQRMQNLVEDFFKHNYRDVTSRKTVEWGEPVVDANGNTSISYKYEMIIWDKDKYLANEIFTFDKDGKFVKVEKVKGFPQSLGSVAVVPEDVSTKEAVQKLVEKFFSRNYRDITARKTIEWGELIRDANNGNVSLRYKYEATIRGKDKVMNNEIFTFDKNGQFVSSDRIDDSIPKDAVLKVYEVNKKVAKFGKEEDFSTPESAYAAINRVMAGTRIMAGEAENQWIHVSVKELAGRLKAQGQQKSKPEPEWVYACLNAKILEVRMCGNKAVVIAELAQNEKNTIKDVIDLRWLALEDGKWLNNGEDRFSNIEEARKKFDKAVGRYKPAEKVSDSSQNVEEKIVQQILTTGYVLSVPGDMPQLKEILSGDKSQAKMLTPEKFEEFINLIKKTPNARIIAAPKILTNDGQVGEIKTDTLNLKVKNTIRPDKKTIMSALDFKYQDKQNSISTSTVVSILSNHATAAAGMVPNNNEPVTFLLVKPEILETGISLKNGVIDTNSNKTDEAKKEQVEITARFLTVPEDNNEIKEFFKAEGLEKVFNNEPNSGGGMLDDGQDERLLKLTQKITDCNVLSAPKVTVNNGEMATITKQQTTRYRKDSQADVNEVKAGTTIKITPVLSDDRSKIVLDIDYEHINLLGFENDKPNTESIHVVSKACINNGGTLVVGGGQRETKEKNGQRVTRKVLCLIKAERKAS